MYRPLPPQYFRPGEMAEWSIAAVLKTVDVKASGGSNPSLSAKSSNHEIPTIVGIFHFEEIPQQAGGLIKKFMKNEKDAAQRSLMI